MTEFSTATDSATTEHASDATTALQPIQQQQSSNAKRRKVVMLPSTTQMLSLRSLNDIIFRLRCDEDLMVSILLDPIGTNSRVVADTLGKFAVNVAQSYNNYTQRQMNVIDKQRGDSVAVSNFLQRKIPDIDIAAIRAFFATMNNNNANDHNSRTLRVAAIFVGLTMCIEFRTELTPPPVHVGRFSQSIVNAVVGGSTSAAQSNTAAAIAARAANEEKEQARRDQLRGSKIDPEALMTFLKFDGRELMSCLFDGVISLPEYAHTCMERYLSYKPAFNPWISRKFHEQMAK